jgi:hypothetical protein
VGFSPTGQSQVAPWTALEQKVLVRRNVCIVVLAEMTKHNWNFDRWRGSERRWLRSRGGENETRIDDYGTRGGGDCVNACHSRQRAGFLWSTVYRAFTTVL